MRLRWADPPTGQPARASPAAPKPGSTKTTAITRQDRKHSKSRFSQSSIPPYAKNPYKVASIADIERRGRTLFDPLKQGITAEGRSARVFKKASIKSLTVNKRASTVAAYFTREAEHNQLLPPQRHALRRIDTQFYQLRRAVLSDARLNRQDKAQLVAVLTFERLKARENLRNTQSDTEVHFMGSAAIRDLIEEEKENPGYSISGAKGLGTDGIRERIKRIMDRAETQADPDKSSERQRELAAKDLYTRKAKFSQNVHYLDKNTDKTLFIDTGKAISMRRSGINEAGVAVALQLAKERFGSTLTINGSDEFKKLVVEAAAKNGLDVHFTDKAMNESLKARREELDIGKDAEHISAAEAVEKSSAQSAPAQDAPTESKAPTATAAVAFALQTLSIRDVEGTAIIVDLANQQQVEKVFNDISAEIVSLTERMDEIIHYQPHPIGDLVIDMIEKRAELNRTLTVLKAVSKEPLGVSMDNGTPVELVDVGPGYIRPSPEINSEFMRRDAEWSRKFPLPSDELGADVVMELRAQDHVHWMLSMNDTLPEADAHLRKYLENDAYRDSFKDSVDKLYAQHKENPEMLKVLDSVEPYDRAVVMVNEIEMAVPVADGQQAVEPNPLQVTRPDPVKIVTGELVDHGPAYYQNDENNKLSYFVKLNTGRGERTLWSVTLAEAMADHPYKPGDRVDLIDHGTVPVVVQQIQQDGSVLDIATERREWSAQPHAPVRSVVESVEQEDASQSGMSTD